MIDLVELAEVFGWSLSEVLEYVSREGLECEE